VTAVVLDGSFVLSVVLEDEISESILHAIKTIRAMPTGSQYVPGHFWIEITNAMLMAERRKRISKEEMERSLDAAFAFPVLTDDETNLRCPRDTVRLAREFALTVYDAAYLELAIRHSAGLATVDKALARAARAAGVDVIPRS
jgi:predicted nucleic acid-binding protein